MSCLLVGPVPLLISNPFFLTIFSNTKFILLYLVIPNISRRTPNIIQAKGVIAMRTRKKPLGDKNVVGQRVTEARLALGMKQVELLAKLQTNGVDMSVPALSLLEGQKRPVTDIELNALADILKVSADWLLGRENE